MVPFVAFAVLVAAAPAAAKGIRRLHSEIRRQLEQPHRASWVGEQAARSAEGLDGKVSVHYKVDGDEKKGEQLQELLTELEQGGWPHMRCPHCGGADVHGKARAKTAKTAG